MTEKPIYILGTGLSHDGSACLLKDGKIIVAIEKERLSRIKHDGGNDFLTVQYCLDFAGIKADDLSLVVQAANFEKDTIQKTRYKGKRFFSDECTVPFVSISHHLAHAYSAAGTSPFENCVVLIADGCGSPYEQCDDLSGAFIPGHVNTGTDMYAEKDSYYFFDGQKMHPLYKDFSRIRLFEQKGTAYMPVSQNSIGGLYSMASNYCFGDMNDAGKLMGLAPYGRTDVFTDHIFNLEDGTVSIREAALSLFDKPMNTEHRPFKEHFQYYADIAKWVQKEVEKAILYLIRSRLQFYNCQNFCYAGGIALNAVANTNVLRHTGIHHFYIEPAAGDNGLSLGCAFYGWLEVMKKNKLQHSGTTLLGKSYSNKEIHSALQQYKSQYPETDFTVVEDDNYISAAARYLQKGKLIGWFQNGAEFGPRALGSRSILADPRRQNVRHTINSEVKFREDFRPFAPSVLKEDVNVYFQYGHESPYMLLTDLIRPEWKDKLSGIVHEDGSCRVQTVTEIWNKPFYDLLRSFKKLSGISVLLNTSFNKKGMPIVETPRDAIDFFLSCKLDVLVLNNIIITKT